MYMFVHSFSLRLSQQPCDIIQRIRPLLLPTSLSILLSECHRCKLPLLRLDFDDFLLDGVFRDQTNAFAGTLLTETMDSIDCLVFDRLRRNC
jgi:hypothetical protein